MESPGSVGVPCSRSATSIMICVVVPVINVDGGAELVEVDVLGVGVGVGGDEVAGAGGDLQ